MMTERNFLYSNWPGTIQNQQWVVGSKGTFVDCYATPTPASGMYVARNKRNVIRIRNFQRSRRVLERWSEVIVRRGVFMPHGSPRMSNIHRFLLVICHL
jgi:hypothetical protein